VIVVADCTRRVSFLRCQCRPAIRMPSKYARLALPLIVQCSALTRWRCLGRRRFLDAGCSSTRAASHHSRDQLVAVVHGPASSWRRTRTTAPAPSPSPTAAANDASASGAATTAANGRHSRPGSTLRAAVCQRTVAKVATTRWWCSSAVWMEWRWWRRRWHGTADATVRHSATTAATTAIVWSCRIPEPTDSIVWWWRPRGSSRRTTRRSCWRRL